MAGFTTETVLIPTNGIRLHAEIAGPPDGPLVILLHGFPEYWYGWRRQIGPLARSGFRVVALDQRGYNLSEKPEGVRPYQIDHLVKDVTGVIDHFARKKAVIVGHDWGGAVAWWLTSTYPERVERLVAINAPHQAAMNRALSTFMLKQILKSWYILYFQIPRLPEWTLTVGSHINIRKALLETSRPGTFSREDFRRYIEAWSQPKALTSGINWYRAITRESFRLGRGATIRKSQKRVRVPALILWGDQDAFLEPVLAQWSLEWVDDGQLVRFPEATHWIQHEEAERVNARILSFCEDLL